MPSRAGVPPGRPAPSSATSISRRPLRRRTLSEMPPPRARPPMTSADAVRERVLDERLKNEERYRRPIDIGRDVDREVEPIGEAQPRNLEIGACVTQLVVERHERAIAMAQQVA